ncbi:ComEA family DNA-binding protein [Microbacterium alcoholitolerans]|uniref:ComEA family DNA-binding protein n=1 Tax=unclassified Microbacterium TaxID=2609290 RepID=UPI003D163CB6
MSTARADQPTVGWMLLMSTWMISAFIPGSIFAWLGFLIVGIIGRMMRWTVVGVVLGALAIVVALPIWGQWQSLIAALLYIAGMLMALMANPGWLRAMWARRSGDAARPAMTSSRSTAAATGTRASRRAKSRSRSQAAKSEARKASPTRTEPARDQRAGRAQRPAPEPTEAEQLARRAGASSAGFFASSGQRDQPSSAEPIDVNTADADALAGLPGITARKARKLVKQRTEQGGFASLDAFATAAGVQPHELVRLRDAATCSRPARGPRRFGRRVDY